MAKALCPEQKGRRRRENGGKNHPLSTCKPELPSLSLGGNHPTACSDKRMAKGGALLGAQP